MTTQKNSSNHRGELYTIGVVRLICGVLYVLQSWTSWNSRINTIPVDNNLYVETNMQLCKLEWIYKLNKKKILIYTKVNNNLRIHVCCDFVQN